MVHVDQINLTVAITLFCVFKQVIYALNTKNDEHETIIQNLRDQHEEEIQQLLAETKSKVPNLHVPNLRVDYDEWFLTFFSNP